jgi:hypothetical protein
MRARHGKRLVELPVSVWCEKYGKRRKERLKSCCEKSERGFGEEWRDTIPGPSQMFHQPNAFFSVDFQIN